MARSRGKLHVRCFVRVVLLFAVCLVIEACTQSPETKQAHQIRSQADQQASAIKSRADSQAAPLEKQATALGAEAKKVGGYEGKRLDVQAHALKEEAKLIRKQADEQSAAIKEAADARIKAIASR